MRHVWGFVSATGLLTLVAFGASASLAAAVDDPGASMSMWISVGGGVVMMVGLAARGDSRSVEKGRRILGGVGLVIAPVTAALGLLQLGTDPPATARFLVVTLVAFALWAQAIALQAGLSFRVAVSWLTLAIGFAIVVFPIAAGVAAGVGAVTRGLGFGSQAATVIGSAVAAAIVAAMLRIWARNRPDRQAVPGAVRRVVFGHALPGDIDTLAKGVGSILRRRPPTVTDAEARAGRLAELDARLGRHNGGAETADVAPVDPGGR